MLRFNQQQIDLLNLLRGSPESALCLDRLAAKLGRPAELIEQDLDSLSTAGYQFARDSSECITLATIPDRLYAHEIETGLQTCHLGKTIHYYENIDSTNIRAAELAREGAAEGELVVAEMQSAGRGRLSRDWHSPLYCGIYASLILRPQVPVAATPGISLLVAVSIAESITRLTGRQAGIKWPNDVLIDGRKTAGILADLSANARSVQYLIVGFGINVNQIESDFPADITDKATSVRIAIGKPLDRVRLLQNALHDFESRYLSFVREGLEAQLPAIKALSSILMKPITFEQKGRTMKGVAVDIDRNGLLIVECDGSRISLAAGEISLQESY